MPLNLEKINPKFRQLVDLLLFSDRMDLNLTRFKVLLKENYDIHFPYLWDRFQKCVEIAWENAELFWNNRLTFLFSINEKTLSKYISEYLEQRMFYLVRTKKHLDVKYDIEYLQFIEYCKVKSARKEDLNSIKNYLVDMPSYLTLDKTFNIINSFIPLIFADINDYAQIIFKKITNSTRNLEMLCFLEQQGIVIDRQPLAQLAKEILIERKHTDKNRRAFFALINDKLILEAFKKEYKPTYKKKLISLLNICDYLLLEELHLRNIKNIILLDNSVADELACIYADKLYDRYVGHKKANANKLIRLIKLVPEVSSKKILVYLSNNNKMLDIKYILSEFPELKKLAAFL